MPFPLALAWTETTAVVAAVYGVPLDELRAPSRGRGPKPRAELIAPRKLALYVTLSLADTDCAKLARHVGLTKDTVSTHVAALRAAGHDDAAEVSIEAVEGLAAARLNLLHAREVAAWTRRGELRAQVATECRKLAQGLEEVAAALSDGPSDASSDRLSKQVRQVVAPLRRAAA